MTSSSIAEYIEYRTANQHSHKKPRRAFRSCEEEKYSAVAWGDLPGPALQQLVSHCDTRAQACLSQTSKAIYWVVKSNLAVARREAIAETKAQLMQRIQETTNPNGGSFEFGGTGTSDIYSRSRGE
ncbi:hypothetical protein WJX75_007569 [Coccomyxa subellipsoidea]|uniref:Uncharacterized protein n=1 Tax=Coccomyxa subellipsoidea TaxID=248742 RepID=A0ABR2YK19_9CHLO